MTAITKNDHSICDRGHLTETMRDVDYSSAVAPQVSDQIEEPFSFGESETRCGLIQDQETRRLSESASDFDQLSLTDRQLFAGRFGIDFESDLLKECFRFFDDLRAIDETVSSRFSTEEEVSTHVEILGEAEFLMDQCDAHRERIANSSKFDGVSIELQSSLIWLIDSGENFHQRRLSRPVFTDQCNHFPGMDIEVDLIECEDRWKSFRDGSSAQPRTVGHP